MQKNKPSGRTIRSVEIAFNIIEFLKENGRSGVTELANELDHSKSTIHSHLQTLEEQKILVQDPNGYRRSLQVLDMAAQVRTQIGNYNVIECEADDLAEETGEIVQFGIEEYGSVSYLYKTSGDHAVETASQPGMYQPMHSTSLGKAILSHLPTGQTTDIIQSMDFEQKTPYTITNEEELHADLKEISEQGYSVDDQENIEGLRCVAAPIKNDNVVLGAISITGPSSRFTMDRIHDELSDKVKRAANIIEINTKFS